MAPAMEAAWLHGKQVAFTGCMASLTRAEAAVLVETLGGQFSPRVTRQTAFLVVGQEGLPLTKKGRLTNKLKTARRLQTGGSPVILAEEDFFERLGLAPQSGGVHRLYSMAQLCRLLRVRRDRLRTWLRAGLIKPVQTVQGIGFFDFQQVTGVKTLCDLTQAGVTPRQIRRSLQHLHRWLPEAEEPLAQLAVLERDGQMLIRLGAGQLAEPSGQLHLDFGDEAGPVTVARPSRTADEWWEYGCQEEEAANLEEAAAAYRQALYLGGPDAKLSFNLGNVLFALGQKGQAAERFRQAVELDHHFAAAWNNLGNVLAELHDLDAAVAAYETALELQPLYADAHYNLADTLDQRGLPWKARTHWQTYLRLDPVGPWADYARRRLA